MLVTALVGAAIAIPTQAALDAARWSPLATRDTDQGKVSVYESAIEGLPCFRGEATTSAPREVLLQVTTDIPSCVAWSKAGLTESKVLAQTGATIDYVQYLDIPGWTMASDRFWFLRLTQSTDATRCSVRWDRMGDRGGPHQAAFDAYVAAHPDAVEPSINVGSWTFETTPTGTRVDYRICTNPGGSIPAFVQNAATKQTLPDTVADVIREANRRAAGR